MLTSDKPVRCSMTAEQINSTARRRGLLFYIKRGLKWLGILLLTLIVLGVAYQTAAAELDKRAFHPAGQMVSVNGHQMHIVCAGQGSPTIILEAGAYSFSAEWYWVQRQLE